MLAAKDPDNTMESLRDGRHENTPRYSRVASMIQIFSKFRLVVYLCALPLVATAVVAAQSVDGTDESKVASLIQSNVDYTSGVPVEGESVNISHALMIDADGGVSGRVVTRGQDGLVGSAGMNVSLNFRGEMIASGETTADGQFRFENVAPGSYSFIATSPASIATFGVYVHEANGDVSPASGEIQLRVAAANSNVDGVRNLLNSEIQTVAYQYVPRQTELPVVTETTVVGLTGESTLTGQIVPLLWSESEPRYNLTGNGVFLFNDQGLVSEAAVDADGSYEMPDVAPGVYDFVSFGPHGAAAMSIEVVEDPSVAATTSEISLVSYRKVIQGGLDVVLSEPTSGNTPSVDVQVVVNQPPITGGFAPTGGIGGIGGIGDFGGIVSAALGAWVLTELIDEIDDNNNVIQQPVVVPPVIIPPATSPF